MRYLADLHIHSRFSRATSKDLRLPSLWVWAQKKGLTVVGTGDLTHPDWLKEVGDSVLEAQEGLFELKEPLRREVEGEVPRSCRKPVRFLLSAETSNIYKRGEKVRKVHNLLLFPDLSAAERFSVSLGKVGNVTSDGRPILGLDSRDLFEMLLEVDERCCLIPAHIWTPWFSAMGSKSGFDSIEECYGDLASRIFAVETGLSSDPPMNWRVSSLDRYTLVSHSDAHSAPNLAREACIFQTELSYPAILDALKSGRAPSYLGTVEFYPQQGKYHLDGHRKCGARMHPAETLEQSGRCPVCGKKVTVGVLNRVEELADREEGEMPPGKAPFHSLVALPDILADLFKVGAKSKRVSQGYENLLEGLGAELEILMDLSLEDVEKKAGPAVTEAVRRVREGQLHIDAGYDGEYGAVRIFEDDERPAVEGQLALFGGDSPKKRSKKTKHRVSQESKRKTKSKGERSATQKERQGSYLNDDQKEAVQSKESAVLVVAGPGTGKTLVLTHRIAHLVRERNVDPSRILAVTFTNKAAEEMTQRLRGLLEEEEVPRVTVSTFHSLGLSILTECASEAALRDGFGIVDEEEKRNLLKDLHPKGTQREIRELSERIAVFKRAVILSEDAHPCPAYEDRLRRDNLVDLEDLILRPFLLLEEGKAADWGSRFLHICVDEYQDVNEAQVKFIQSLFQGGEGIFAIGDPDQAIYGFRGASPSHFKRFDQDFLRAVRYQLRMNYRSSPVILKACRQVLPGDPFLAGVPSGIDSVLIHEAPTEGAEAEFVVHSVEDWMGGTGFFSLDSGRTLDDSDEQIGFSDVAVLIRTRRLIAPVKEAFERSGMPFEAVGEEDLLEGQEARALKKLIQKRMLEISPEGSLKEWLENLGRNSEQSNGLEQARWSRLCFGLANIVSRDNGDELSLLRAMSLRKGIDFYDSRADRIVLMTLHASKGLEFPVVFIVGCEDGLLPWNRSEDLEEERRLFYVGITRAQRRLILTHARKRLVYGKRVDMRPSPFLEDIEQDLKSFGALEPRRKRKETERQMSLF